MGWLGGGKIETGEKESMEGVDGRGLEKWENVDNIRIHNTTMAIIIIIICVEKEEYIKHAGLSANFEHTDQNLPSMVR